MTILWTYTGQAEQPVQLFHTEQAARTAMEDECKRIFPVSSVILGDTFLPSVGYRVVTAKLPQPE